MNLILRDIALSFSSPPWQAALAVVLAVLFSAYIYRRTNPAASRSLRLTLAALRAAALALIIAALFDVVAELTWERRSRPVLAVAVDQSASMTLADRSGPREEQVRSLLNHPLFEELRGRYELRPFVFSSHLQPAVGETFDSLRFKGDETDLSAALEALNRAAEPSWHGVLLISDGCYTRGGNPVRRAAELKLPVYTVGVGSEEPIADLAVARVETAPYVYAGRPTTVRVALPRQGFGALSLPLTLPSAGHREERGEARPGVTAAVPGARILVVDDEPNITELLRYQLERAGYRVYTARRGEEALAIARQEHPDLITLDILMAGMDGQEVLEHLKADERTADIPVVIISIVAEKENLMALGAVDFLPKPLEEADLLLTIGRILGRPGEAATILVADDDPDIVGWLRRVLVGQGYQVYEAVDGEEALQTALAVLPDLIVLDLRMPRMDGREVITRLKLREETCEIPIIVITASSVDRETDRVQILGLGAEGFLTKPFPAEHLIREIEAVLRKKTEATRE